MITEKSNKRPDMVRIIIPNQNAYCITHKYKGDSYRFFNDKESGENRGCIIGKGLRPTINIRGEVVSDYGWRDVVDYFKKEKGFLVFEGVDAIEPYREKSKKSNNSVNKSVKVVKEEPEPEQVEEDKSDKKDGVLEEFVGNSTIYN